MTQKRIAIVLTNLRAEGGPVLGADLAAEWRSAGHDPIIFLLNADDMAMADRFQAIGVPVLAMGVGIVEPKRYLSIAAKARSIFLEHHPDAVVTIPSGVHGPVFLGAALTGVRRRVLHFGGYPWHWRRDFWKYRTVMRLGGPVTPDLVCVSRHVADGVSTHFGSISKRVHVVPNGIDLTAFAFRGDPIPVEGGTIKVLMVGRLDSDKDHGTLISAIGCLAKRGVSIRLQLAGDGALRNTIKKKVSDEGLGGSVEFLGARRDVPSLLAAADVFAFSVRPEEGFGIALVEAMSVGVPIVATDVGACREVLNHGEAGSLVPSDNPVMLADAIEMAARRPDKRQVRSARWRAEKVYSRAAMAAGYGKLCGL